MNNSKNDIPNKYIPEDNKTRQIYSGIFGGNSSDSKDKAEELDIFKDIKKDIEPAFPNTIDKVYNKTVEKNVDISESLPSDTALSSTAVKREETDTEWVETPTDQEAIQEEKKLTRARELENARMSKEEEQETLKKAAEEVFGTNDEDDDIFGEELAEEEEVRGKRRKTKKDPLKTQRKPLSPMHPPLQPELRESLYPSTEEISNQPTNSSSNNTPSDVASEGNSRFEEKNKSLDTKQTETPAHREVTKIKEENIYEKKADNTSVIDVTPKPQGEIDKYSANYAENTTATNNDNEIIVNKISEPKTEQPIITNKSINFDGSTRINNTTTENIDVEQNRKKTDAYKNNDYYEKERDDMSIVDKSSTNFTDPINTQDTIRKNTDTELGYPETDMSKNNNYYGKEHNHSSIIDGNSSDSQTPAHTYDAPEENIDTKQNYSGINIPKNNDYEKERDNTSIDNAVLKTQEETNKINKTYVEETKINDTGNIDRDIELKNEQLNKNNFTSSNNTIYTENLNEPQSIDTQTATTPINSNEFQNAKVSSTTVFPSFGKQPENKVNPSRVSNDANVLKEDILEPSIKMYNSDTLNNNDESSKQTEGHNQPNLKDCERPIVVIPKENDLSEHNDFHPFQSNSKQQKNNTQEQNPLVQPISTPVYTPDTLLTRLVYDVTEIGRDLSEQFPEHTFSFEETNNSFNIVMMNNITHKKETISVSMSNYASPEISYPQKQIRSDVSSIPSPIVSSAMSVEHFEKIHEIVNRNTTYTEKLPYSNEKMQEGLQKVLQGRSVSVSETPTSIFVSSQDNNGINYEAVVNKTTGTVESNSPAIAKIVDKEYSKYVPAQTYQQPVLNKTNEFYTSPKNTAEHLNNSDIHSSLIKNATSFKGQRPYRTTTLEGWNLESLNEFVKKSDNSLPILYQKKNTPNAYVAKFGADEVILKYDAKTLRMTSEVQKPDVTRLVEATNRYTQSVKAEIDAHNSLNKYLAQAPSIVARDYLDNSIIESAKRISNANAMPLSINNNGIDKTNNFHSIVGGQNSSVYIPNMLNPYKKADISKSAFAEQIKWTYLNANNNPKVPLKSDKSAKDILAILNTDNALPTEDFEPLGTTEMLANDKSPRSHISYENEAYSFMSAINPKANLTPYKTIGTRAGFKSAITPLAFIGYMYARQMAQNTEITQPIASVEMYGAAMVSMFKPPTQTVFAYKTVKYLNTFIGKLPTAENFVKQLKNIGINNPVINNLKDATYYVQFVDKKAQELGFNLQNVSESFIDNKINEIKSILITNKNISATEIAKLNEKLDVLSAAKTGRNFGTSPQQLTDLYKEWFNNLGVDTSNLTNILNREEAAQIHSQIRTVFQQYGIKDVFSLSSKKVEEIIASGRVTDTTHLKLLEAISTKDFKTFGKQIFKQSGLQSRLQPFLIVLARSGQDTDTIQGGLLVYRTFVTVKSIIKTSHRILKLAQKRIVKKLKSKGLDVKAQQMATKFVKTRTGKVAHTGYKAAKKSANFIKNNRVVETTRRVSNLAKTPKKSIKAVVNRVRNSTKTALGNAGIKAATATTATTTTTATTGTAVAAGGTAGLPVILIVLAVILILVFLWVSGMAFSKIGMSFMNMFDSKYQSKTVQVAFDELLSLDEGFVQDNFLNVKITDEQLSAGTWKDVVDNSDTQENEKYNNNGYYNPVKKETYEIKEWGWDNIDEDMAKNAIPSKNSTKTSLGTVYDGKWETHELGRISRFFDSPSKVYYFTGENFEEGNTKKNIITVNNDNNRKEITFDSNAREIISCADALIFGNSDSQNYSLGSKYVEIFKGYTSKGIYYSKGQMTLQNGTPVTLDSQATSLWTATHGIQTDTSNVYSCNGCQILNKYECNSQEWKELCSKYGNGENEGDFVYNKNSSTLSSDGTSHIALPYNERGCYQHSKAETSTYTINQIASYSHKNKAEVNNLLNYYVCNGYHYQNGKYVECDGHYDTVYNISTNSDYDLKDDNVICKDFNLIKNGTITKNITYYVHSEVAYYCAPFNSNQIGANKPCKYTITKTLDNGKTLTLYAIKLSEYIGKNAKYSLPESDCLYVALEETPQDSEIMWFVACIGHSECGCLDMDDTDTAMSNYNVSIKIESVYDKNTNSYRSLYIATATTCKNCMSPRTAIVTHTDYEAYCNGHCDGHGPNVKSSKNYCIYCTGHKDLICNAYIISGTDNSLNNNEKYLKNGELYTINNGDMKLLDDGTLIKKNNDVVKIIKIGEEEKPYLEWYHLPFNTIYSADTCSGPISIWGQLKGSNLVGSGYLDTADKADFQDAIYGGRNTWFCAFNGTPTTLDELTDAIAESEMLRYQADSRATSDWILYYSELNPENVQLEGDAAFSDFEPSESFIQLMLKLIGQDKDRNALFQQIFLQPSDTSGIMSTLPDDTSDAREKFLTYAISSVGNIPFNRNTISSDISLYYKNNNFGQKMTAGESDTGNRYLKGLNENQWLVWCYNSAFIEDKQIDPSMSENAYVSDNVKSQLKWTPSANNLKKNINFVTNTNTPVPSQKLNSNTIKNVKPGDILVIDNVPVIFINWLTDDYTSFYGISMNSSEFAENVVIRTYTVSSTKGISINELDKDGKRVDKQIAFNDVLMYSFFSN